MCMRWYGHTPRKNKENLSSWLAARSISSSCTPLHHLQTTGPSSSAAHLVKLNYQYWCDHFLVPTTFLETNKQKKSTLKVSFSSCCIDDWPHGKLGIKPTIDDLLIMRLALCRGRLWWLSMTRMVEKMDFSRKNGLQIATVSTPLWKKDHNIEEKLCLFRLQEKKMMHRRQVHNQLRPPAAVHRGVRTSLLSPHGWFCATWIVQYHYHQIKNNN